MSRKAKGLMYLTALTLVSVLALFVIGLKMAVAGKRPPEPTWGAQIVDYGNLIGMAPDHVYKGTDPNVRVTVQQSKFSGIVTSSTIHFFIYANTDPPQTYAVFRDVILQDLLYGESGPLDLCGFPGPSTSETCALDFINSWHPKPGYDHLLLLFVVGADLEDMNIFPLNTPVQWTGSGATTVYFWNAFDPLSALDPQPYESVTASLNDRTSDMIKGVWITRLDANAWEIRVEQQVFGWTQFYSYATMTTGRNGRTSTTITNYQPLAAKGELTYKIKLIKNPM